MSSAIPAGKAFVEVGLVSKISAGARQIQREAAAIGAGLKSLGTTTLASGAAMTAGFGGALAAMSFPVKLAADAEMTQASFTALTGSAEKARAVIGELRAFAAATPFEFAALSKSAETLMAFGVETENVIPALRMLGDVARGDQQKMDRLVLAFAQVRSKGRLMGQELNQITENGFNPLQQMSQRTGRVITDLYKDMENGKITFGMVANEFDIITSRGGLFFGAMDEQAKTFIGQMAALSDEIKQAMIPIGQALMDFVKPAVVALRGMVASTKDFAQYIGPIAVGLGAISVAGVAAGVALTGAGVAMMFLGSAAAIVTAGLGALTFLTGLPVVLIPIAGALASMAVGFIAVTGGMAAIAYRSGLLGDAFKFVGSEAGKMLGPVMDAFDGIRQALSAGDLSMAAKIGWAGAKVVFFQGLDSLLAAFNRVFRNLGSIVARFFTGMAQIAYDVFVSIPKMLFEVLRGANIGQMLQDAFAGRLNFGLDGRALADARAELDALLKQNAARPQPQQDQGQRQRFNAGDGTGGNQEAIQQQIDAQKAFEDRRKQLEKEITTLTKSADAAELAELEQKGLTQAQLNDIKALQDRRRLIEEEKAKNDEADRKRKQRIEDMQQEGQALAEAVRTPIEVLNDELRRNTELQRAGAISERTRQRADMRAFERFQQDNDQQPNNARNSIAMANSREAIETLRRSLGLVSPTEWTQRLVDTANQQLIATADQTSAINALASQGITFAGLERLTQEHIDETKRVLTAIREGNAKVPTIVSIGGG